jgi:hypothetical protein
VLARLDLLHFTLAKALVVKWHYFCGRLLSADSLGEEQDKRGQRAPAHHSLATIIIACQLLTWLGLASHTTDGRYAKHKMT